MSNWVKAMKKVLGVGVELGCMDIVSRTIDKISNRYTNPVSKVLMRTSGVCLGGYLGSKASKYLDETIDRGLKLANDLGVKTATDEKEEEGKDTAQ